MSNVIGLDIGGTKITGVVWNGKAVVESVTISTPLDRSGFFTALTELVYNLTQIMPIQTMGVGFPGVVDLNGKVVYAPNLKFLEGVNLFAHFKVLDLARINIENDANCFALAEATLGAGKVLRNFLVMTLGTGIGGGWILGKQLYVGPHGSAGEIGHMLADTNYTYERLFQKYRNNKNYPALGRLLGRLWANLYNCLDMEAIILGGSVTQSAPKFMNIACQELRQHLLNPGIQPKVLISKIKDAGSVGAALLMSPKRKFKA